MMAGVIRKVLVGAVVAVYLLLAAVVTAVALWGAVSGGDACVFLWGCA